MNSNYVWQRFYEQAILETDPSRLPMLVQAARAAIDVRIGQLRSESHVSASEQEAIADALTGLRVLTQEVGSKQH